MKISKRDAAVAKRLHGTSGRMFVHMGDGIWTDTASGRTGSRAELEDAFLAELDAREEAERASNAAAAYWQAGAGGQPRATN